MMKIKDMSSKQIIPSVVSSDFGGVREKIEQAENFSEWIHLDITDGVFTDPQTWNNPDDLNEIGGKIKIETHLMVEKIEEEIIRWLGLADRIIFHYEATSNPENLIEVIHLQKSQAGVALLLDTPVSEIVDILPSLDVVHLMSIKEIGAYGASFDESIFDKIKELRKLAPNVKINVDGGINDGNTKQIIEAGADNLISGSFIWKSPDPKEAYNELVSLIK